MTQEVIIDHNKPCNKQKKGSELKSSETSRVDIYPNPVSDVLTFEVFTLETQLFNNQELAIKNMQGQIVLSKVLAMPFPGKMEENMDVSALRKGNYFLVLGDRTIPFMKN